MPKLIGGTDTLMVGKKVYRPGDSVPLSKEQERRLYEAGLRFEDNDPAMVGTTTAAMVEGVPMDDRGQAMMEYAEKDADATPRPEQQAAGAKSAV